MKYDFDWVMHDRKETLVAAAAAYRLKRAMQKSQVFKWTLIKNFQKVLMN